MFLKSKRFLSLFLCAVLTLAAFSPVFGEISSESTGTKFFSDIDTEKVIAFYSSRRAIQAIATVKCCVLLTVTDP